MTPRKDAVGLDFQPPYVRGDGRIALSMVLGLDFTEIEIIKEVLQDHALAFGDVLSFLLLL